MVVVGSGIAGLTTALHVSRHSALRVLLVTKDVLAAGTSFVSAPGCTNRAGTVSCVSGGLTATSSVTWTTWMAPRASRRTILSPLRRVTRTPNSGVTWMAAALRVVRRNNRMDASPTGPGPLPVCHHPGPGARLGPGPGGR